MVRNLTTRTRTLEWRRYVFTNLSMIVRRNDLSLFSYFFRSNETRSDLHRLNAQSKLSGSRIVWKNQKHARGSRVVHAAFSQWAMLSRASPSLSFYYVIFNNSSLARLIVLWRCWHSWRLRSCWQASWMLLFSVRAIEWISSFNKYQICEQVQHM